jgi:hypothetical protein
MSSVGEAENKEKVDNLLTNYWVNSVFLSRLIQWERLEEMQPDYMYKDYSKLENLE